VRALCARAILLNSGRVVTDGKPVDVLNHYQKIIMEREHAYEERTAVASGEPAGSIAENLAPLSFTYRHGDRSAQVLAAELTDTARRRAEIVETGEPLTIRLLARVNEDLDDPVVGFLIRNRHGISAYGTNTKEQQIELGAVRRGDLIEVTFFFNCWLGVDQYSVTCAVHSRDGKAYDWLDGVSFFRVTSTAVTEGVANLNASVSARLVSGARTPRSEVELQEITGA
jgi:hypothetical protein